MNFSQTDNVRKSEKHNFPTNAGSITVIMGPMFSGKTTELLRLHDRQVIAKRNCVLVKYAGDTRYDKELVATHSRMTGQGQTVKAHRLEEVYSHLINEEVQVVSIDEGQFFDDLAETCEKLAELGKIVLVAVLSGTFERKPFAQVSLLLPLAEEVIKLTAVCVDCGNQGIYSFRNTMEKKVEVIGGSETYMALCRSCYSKKNSEKVEKEKLSTFCEKSENNEEIVSIRFSPKNEVTSDGSSSPPRKKIGLSKSLHVDQPSVSY